MWRLLTSVFRFFNSKASKIIPYNTPQPYSEKKTLSTVSCPLVITTLSTTLKMRTWHQNYVMTCSIFHSSVFRMYSKKLKHMMLGWAAVYTFFLLAFYSAWKDWYATFLLIYIFHMFIIWCSHRFKLLTSQRFSKPTSTRCFVGPWINITLLQDSLYFSGVSHSTQTSKDDQGFILVAR